LLFALLSSIFARVRPPGVFRRLPFRLGLFGEPCCCADSPAGDFEFVSVRSGFDNQRSSFTVTTRPTIPDGGNLVTDLKWSRAFLVGLLLLFLRRIITKYITANIPAIRKIREKLLLPPSAPPVPPVP
jgi:hypothetical protein